MGRAGGGSAAFAAAIRGRDLGARVAVIERSTIGGTCVNVGCVPSKALLRAGEIRHLAARHGLAGLHTGAGPPGRAGGAEGRTGRGATKEKYENLVAEHGFDLIRGDACFIDGRTVALGAEHVQAGAYVVATGAAPAVPPIPGLADAGYLTSTSALELSTVPESLAVIGANTIGLELGQFFGHLGSRVTFFDVLDRIAPFEEPEISEAPQAAVYALRFGLATTDLADTWSPYLTMAESLKLAAQTFTRDVTKLSCCAA